jgi:hypothetical protein
MLIASPSRLLDDHGLNETLAAGRQSQSQLAPTQLADIIEAVDLEMKA